MIRPMRSQVVRILSLCLVVLVLFSAQPLAAKTRLPAWNTFAAQFIESYLSTHPPFAANAGRHECQSAPNVC